MLQNDIASQYGGAFVTVVSQPTITGGTTATPGTVIPCPPCNSGTPVSDEMLAGDACLLPGETLIVQVTIAVDPNDGGAFFNFYGALENQGTTTGVGEESGKEVEDLSDDGTDPNGDNGDGGTNDPTPAWFPDIDVAKQIDPANPPII